MSIAVVTGGVQGIGRAIVTALHERGDTVVVVDVAAADDERVQQLPYGCAYHRIDVSEREQVVAGMQAIIAQHGKIDILVNNAGVTCDGIALRQVPMQWRQVMAVNLDGTFWFCQAALVHMVRQRSGVIINMSSVVAQSGNPGQVNYAASKAGVESVTKTLAREYGKRGIRINGIAPGFIATPMTEKLADRVKEQAVARTALGRAGQPEEVAQLVCFLSSPLSAYITGQIIHINGGMW